MNLVFQLAKRPDLVDAQRLSETLDQQRGVVSALVDPQLARVFVTFDPDLTGDLALQSVVEELGYPVSQEVDALDLTPEGPVNREETPEPAPKRNVTYGDSSREDRGI
jgi:copper chaperone CopZ